MPKRGKLVTAYKDGDTFRKYILTYGKIEMLKDFDDASDGKPVRLYHVLIDGVRATLTMKRGEVVRYGYGLIEDSPQD
jgi:hypothetical protein